MSGVLIHFYKWMKWFITYVSHEWVLSPLMDFLFCSLLPEPKVFWQLCRQHTFSNFTLRAGIIFTIFIYYIANIIKHPFAFLERPHLSSGKGVGERSNSSDFCSLILIAKQQIVICWHANRNVSVLPEGLCLFLAMSWRFFFLFASEEYSQSEWMHTVRHWEKES